MGQSSDIRDHHSDLQSDDGFKAYNHLDDGCPTFIPKNKVFNVLKFHSDYRMYHPDDAARPNDGTCLPASTKSLGVISDGQQGNASYKDLYNTAEYKNTPPNTNPFGENQFLNLNNSREIYNESDFDPGFFEDACKDSILNLPIDNELRPVDGNGDFVFNLYKKAQTINIDNPVSGSSNQKVDSMEWLFFSSPVKKCQKGYIWLEISDPRLTGWTTDNTIYAYYWEGTQSDSATIESHLTSGIQPITDPNFRMLNNNNRCVQAFRMSDITGGTDKKLIIGCNKFTTVGEELYVNLLIGLKPNDIFRGYQYKNKATEFFDMSVGDVGSPVFKYTKAEFKFGGLSSAIWNNKPSFYSGQGYVDAQDGVNAPYTIAANFQYLDNNGEGVINRSPQTGWTTANTKMGIPNGGIRQTLFDLDLANGTPPGLTSSFLNSQALFGVGLQFSGTQDTHYQIAQIYKTPATLLDDQETNFIFRMPRCWGGYGGTSSSNTEYGVVGNKWYRSGFASSSFTVKLYVGADVSQLGSLIQWKDLRDSFIQIASWDANTFSTNFNSLSNYMAGASPTPADPFGDDNDDPYEGLTDGFPRNHPNASANLLDAYRYVNINLKAIFDGGFSEASFCLYLCLESGSHGLKPGTLSHNTSKFDQDPTANVYEIFTPSGYTPNQFYPETQEPTQHGSSGVMYFKNEYGVPPAALDQGGQVGNCGSFIFKPPQIIDKNLKPSPENYYQ